MTGIRTTRTRCDLWWRERAIPLSKLRYLCDDVPTLSYVPPFFVFCVFPPHLYSFHDSTAHFIGQFNDILSQLDATRFALHKSTEARRMQAQVPIEHLDGHTQLYYDIYRVLTSVSLP